MFLWAYSRSIEVYAVVLRTYIVAVVVVADSMGWDHR
jgi:hypothetical protein